MTETNNLDDEEVGCHHSGICVAPAGASCVTSCIYCGKELHERGGQWWTWDADQFENPRPQQQQQKE